MLEVDIEKSYSDFRLQVNFTAENNITALLGASGCGKSLTLKCIAGIIRPDKGHIRLNGRVLFDSTLGINLPPQQRNCGYLFQNYALFPHMTVWQNIGAALRGVSGQRRDRETRARLIGEALQKFGLSDLAQRYPGQLSGGQQQRVALARLSAGQPQLIMLDEPLSALDNYLRWQMEQEILDLLTAHPGPTLFVSHDRDEVYRLCDQIALLDQGHIDMTCPKQHMFDSPRTVAAAKLTGCKNISRARRLDERHLQALDWGCVLESALDLPERLSHVGCRSHFIQASSKKEENRLSCRIERVIEDSFSLIVLLRHPEALPDTPPLRWELAKGEYAGLEQGGMVEIFLPPQRLLLLHG